MNSFRYGRSVITWICVVLSTLSTIGHLGAEATTLGSLEFIRRLQQRQLHRLAESFCRQQLDLVTVIDEQHAPLVVALVTSLAGRALSQTDLDDTQLWDEAVSLGADYADQLPEAAAGLNIRLHVQIARLAHAESLLAAANLELDAEARREQANHLLRDVIKSVRKLEDRIAKTIRINSTAGRDGARRLQRLRQQVQFSEATALLRQTGCYPDRSPDRVHLLTQARQQFNALARLKPPSELTWASYVHEIECYRLLRNLELARQRLAQYKADQLPSPFRLRWTIEKARLEIQEGNPRAAADLLTAETDAGRASDDPDTDADLRLCRVEAFAALAKQSGNEQQSWTHLALNEVRHLENHASTYWVRRAESILTSHHVDNGGATSVDIVLRTAANLYRRGQYQEASVGYLRAAEMMRELGDEQQAFSTELKSAAVLSEAKDDRAASAAFRQLAIKNPENGEAALAHWMAITSMVERVRKDTSLLPEYDDLLNEHLRRWPQSRWLDDVKFWRGRLMAQQNNIAAAIPLWQSIKPESDRFADAMSELRLAYHHTLGNLTGDQQQRLALDARDRFSRWGESILQHDKNDSVLALNANLTAAEFTLLYDVTPSVSTALQPSNGDPVAASAQHFPNRSWVLVGLNHALNGRRESALEEWLRVDWNSYDLVVPLGRRLHQALSNQEAGPRSDQIGRALWDWVERLQDSERWKGNPQLLRQGAAALSHLGQPSEAITILTRLTAESPLDTHLVQALAEQYEARGIDGDHQRAADSWRTAVSLTNHDDALWYRAKLGIARNLVELGETQRAAEMIRVLQVLHPELGGPELKDEFLELLTLLQERD